VKGLGYGLLLGVVVPFLLRWAYSCRKPELRDSHSGVLVLRFPTSYVILLGGCLFPFALLLLYALVLDPSGIPKAVQISAIFLAPGSVLEWYIARYRVEVSEQEIVRRGFGRRIHIQWRDLTSVRWHNTLGVLIFSGSPPRRPRVVIWPVMDGLQSISSRLIESRMYLGRRGNSAPAAGNGDWTGVLKGKLSRKPVEIC
jgi:hypothetical protein